MSESQQCLSEDDKAAIQNTQRAIGGSRTFKEQKERSYNKTKQKIIKINKKLRGRTVTHNYLLLLWKDTELAGALSLCADM